MSKLWWVLTIVALMLNGFLLTRLWGLYLVLGNTQKQLTAANQRNVMVLEMDASCFNQIKNSTDGIIRLKINK